MAISEISFLVITNENLLDRYGKIMYGCLTIFYEYILSIFINSIISIGGINYNVAYHFSTLIVYKMVIYTVYNRTT